MQLKTILNRVTNYKSFVFGKITLREDLPIPMMEVEVMPRANGRPICSGCGKPGSIYDTMPTPRRFDFVPLWGFAVVFVYSMRRVNCRHCGVKVERVPWANGKSTMTNEYKWYLAKWARRMSWKEISEAFHVSWDRVFEAVKHAVHWGLAHRSLDDITTIGVDKVQWHRGHKYQTVVYELGEGSKRLLWIGPDRKAKTLLRFFRFLGKERTAELQFICSDRWRGYLKVIRKKASHAIHVLDRFHVMQRLNKAMNDVRAAEVKQLKEDGYEPVLTGGRWVLLKRPANLTQKQAVKLKELLQYNLKSVRDLQVMLGGNRFRIADPLAHDVHRELFRQLCLAGHEVELDGVRHRRRGKILERIRVDQIFRRAALKNCLAFPHRFRTVASDGSSRRR